MEYDNGVKDEYQAIESRRGWQPLFMEIREKSANYSIAESKKLANRDLNRYRDVNPFDHSRIILNRGTCNYINASLIKMQTVGRNYILTQGPLPSTVSHFWAMVWEQSCRIIVMLNNTIEKNQVKCHTYWPIEVGHNSMLVLDDVKLSVELTEEISQKNYILRILKLEDMDGGISRIVQQYHYTTWPDFGVPGTPSDFIQFLQDIRKTGNLGPGSPEGTIGPAVVHCSAGIGRSGTFCIVDTALLQLERGERVNVKELVLEMRRYRMGLIQTAEQLRFSYQSIIEGAESLGIDLRSTVPSQEHTNEIRPEEESDSSEVDESISEEESEEESTTPPERPHHYTINQLLSGSEGISTNEMDVPPPIPPRAESLCSPENYDRPLPLRPKRPIGEVDGSTTSETEDENVVIEPNNDDFLSSETERKRRKQLDQSFPRVAESENGSMRQRRQERKEKTQQIINNIKEKQKEFEKNADLQRRSGSKWVGIGVGIFILVCVGFRYFQG